MTVLTVIAGAVDAVSFLTLGKVFCALVTGNVLFPSFAPAGEGDVPVARAVAAFATGAAAGLTLTALDARGRPWFVAGPAGEGLLLIAAGAVALGRHGLAKVVDHTDYVVVGGGPGDEAAGVHGPAHARARHADPAEPDRPRGVGRRPGAPPPPRVTGAARPARSRWAATVLGIFVGGVLGTWLLVPLGPGRVLTVIGVAVLLCAAACHVALLRRGDMSGRG